MPDELESAVAHHRLITRRLFAAASKVWCDLDISMAQLKGLFVLHEEGQTGVGGLAERLGIGLPAASLLADRLVQSGFAERLDDATDRRRVLIRLTPKGEELAARLRQGSAAQLRSWMETLEPQDFAALTRGLRALAEVASRHAPAGQVSDRAAAQAVGER